MGTIKFLFKKNIRSMQSFIFLIRKPDTPGRCAFLRQVFIFHFLPFLLSMQKILHTILIAFDFFFNYNFGKLRQFHFLIFTFSSSNTHPVFPQFCCCVDSSVSKECTFDGNHFLLYFKVLYFIVWQLQIPPFLLCVDVFVLTDSLSIPRSEIFIAPSWMGKRYCSYLKFIKWAGMNVQ